MFILKIMKVGWSHQYNFVDLYGLKRNLKLNRYCLT